jgi:hypothetical protein
MDKLWTIFILLLDDYGLLFIISTMFFCLLIMRKLKLLNVIFYGTVVIF